VLRRLREDTVSNLSDPYARLIAEFVADIHKEVVDAHDWSRMDRGILLTIAPGRTQYSLGDGSTDIYASAPGLYRGAHLRYHENGMPVAYLYETLTDVSSNDPCGELAEGSEARVNAAVATGASAPARPDEFSFVPDHPDYAGPTIRINCNPDATYYMYLRFHNPEEEIDPDTDTNRQLAAPSKPIVLGAVYLALNERGEEMGEPGHVAEQKYRVALAAEIERDRLRLGRTNQYEFTRD